MRTNETKIAYIIYYVLREKSFTKNKIRRLLEAKIGYSLNYSTFQKLYNEAMETIQKSPMFSNVEKSMQVLENSTNLIVQTNTKTTSVENQNTPQNDFVEEPLFVEDYSTVVETPQQEHPQIDIDELFSAPVREEEIVSDTNSTEVATVSKTSIDKTKIKKKAKSKEVVEAEIVDTVAEDGYKCYDFMDSEPTRVWIDFDKFQKYLFEKYDVDKNSKGFNHLYQLDWYSNLLLSNVYFNEVVEKKFGDFFQFLKKDKRIYTDRFSALLMKHIQEKGSNFLKLSEEYPDFKESQDIQNSDMFWIIDEWKKGTGSKKYLDTFIGNSKRTILEEYDGVSEKEIDMMIEKALGNWELKEEDIHLPDIKLQFVSEKIYDIEEYDYIEGFMPEKMLLNYKPPMSADDDFSELISRPTGENEIVRANEIGYILVRSEFVSEKTSLFYLWNEIYDNPELERIYREDVFLLKEGFYTTGDINEDKKESIRLLKEIGKWNKGVIDSYRDWELYRSYIENQERIVFEYNKSVQESKKRAIRKEFEENGILV